MRLTVVAGVSQKVTGIRETPTPRRRNSHSIDNLGMFKIHWAEYSANNGIGSDTLDS